MISPFPFILGGYFLWTIFRRREYPAAPLVTDDSCLKRIERIYQLVEIKELDSAVREVRVWLAESDTEADLRRPEVFTCFAEVLWAHLPGLPGTAHSATSFGEELLARIRMTPSTSPRTRFHTVLALARAAEASEDAVTAKERYQEAVEIANAIGTIERPVVVAVLLGLAAACQEMGSREEALRHLERALGMQDGLPNGEPALLEILARTGWMLLEKGDLSRAREALERAVTIGRQFCTEREYASSGAGECLGRVLVAQDEIAAAVSRLTDTLDVEERVFGSDSPALVSTLFWLSDAYARAGSLPDAVGGLERVRAIARSAAGGQAAGSEFSFALAKLKLAQGLCEESKRLLAEALEIEARRPSRADSHLLPILAEMAVVCRLLSDPAGERDALERSLAIAETVHGGEAAELIPILEPLGLLVWNAGELERACDINRRLSRIQRQHLGPEHPDLTRTLVNHGIASARLGEHGHAVQLFASAMDILEVTPLPPREMLERTVEVLESLQTHPVNGTTYRELLPRARALRRAAVLAAPIARA